MTDVTKTTKGSPAIPDPLTADERRCYADDVWRHATPNATLERLWEAYVALESERKHWRAIARAMDMAVHSERFGCEIRVDALGGGMIPSDSGPWIHRTALCDGEHALDSASANGLTWEGEA